MYECMHVYLKNNPAKFHRNSIWKDGALSFLKRSPQQEEEEEQQQQKQQQQQQQPDE